jgi:general L-amino acid transport system substrate-binding protein
MKRIKLLAALAALTLVIAACTEATDETTTTAEPGDGGTVAPPAGEVLAAVQERGTLNCGVNDAVPGFGFVDEDGAYSGFDIDYCRAVAAAVLGDPDAVEFKPLDAGQRFTALQSGEIDVLIRNTTRTAGRDGGEGGTFLTTTFYDGQGMMVRADSGITQIEGLANTAICSLTGTTTELNVTTRMGDIPFDLQTFDDNETLQAAFIAGTCDGWTSDKSQLAAVRSAFPDGEGGPEALVILDETFSKEPLGPVVRDGDSQWAQIIDWVVIATIQAEEFGITSDNVGTFSDPEDDNIRRFLGLEVTDADGNVSIFDPGLGIDPGWTVSVIEAVGNYAEIYERNVAPVGIPRGVNSLWTDGGLLYAPPYR